MAVILVWSAAAAMADSNADEAKRLYALGNQHFALAEYEPAVNAFKEAYRLKEDPAFLYNIAQCYRQMRGQEENAIRLYRSFLQRVPNTPNRDEVERKIAELERAIAEAAAHAPQQPPQQPAPQQQPVMPPQQPVMPSQPAMPPQPAMPLRWERASGGRIPAGAIAAGIENGRPLAICHADHAGGQHPGKVVAKACNISYGGAELTIGSYEVLVADASSLDWVAAAAGEVPVGAIAGGQENGAGLAICRFRHAGATHPGKLVGTRCAIGYGGKEIYSDRYEILIDRAAAAAASAPPVAVAPTKQKLNAGPLWNNRDAGQKCPGLCGANGGKWTGQWSTTVPGKMSVCECAFGQ